MEVEQFVTPSIGLHKFADTIFEITQQPFYITSQTWSDKI